MPKDSHRVHPFQLPRGHVLVVGHVEDVLLSRGPRSSVSGVTEFGVAKGVCSKDRNNLSYVGKLQCDHRLE